MKTAVEVELEREVEDLRREVGTLRHELEVKRGELAIALEDCDDFAQQLDKLRRAS